METRILKFDSLETLRCLAIRRKVFINEQKVPENREQDGLDAEAFHYLFTVHNRPIGTARSRLDAHGAERFIKIERFAFLPEARGSGLASKAFKAVMEDCIKRYPPFPIKISAQAYLRSFYERLGFQAKGDIFQDSGIDHIWMIYTAHLG